MGLEVFQEHCSDQSEDGKGDSRGSGTRLTFAISVLVAIVFDAVAHLHFCFLKRKEIIISE